MGRGLAAVITLQRLLQTGAEPTADELAELKLFPGWGATQELFDSNSKKYAAERELFNEIWGETEWRAARRTVLNAHYTNPAYVKAVWDTFDRLGVPVGAQILEPGSGSGNFIAQAREGDRLVGVELDPTTANIARLLHPQATILNESFAETRLEGDGFDAAIGNVPFSEVVPFDPAYNKAGLSLHNAFIVKSLRMTKPGGIVALMTSRWTMDGKREKSRRELAKYGELLGAVRMPRGAHDETAGTEAIIDLLVFRRHDGQVSTGDESWIKTVDFDGSQGSASLNTYFVDNPDMVIGKTDTRMGQFGPEITVEAEHTTAAFVAPALDRALTKITDKAISQGKKWDADGKVVTDRPVATILQDPAKLVGRVYVDESGALTQVGLQGPEPLKIPKNAQKEMHALLKLRDVAVSLLDAEAATREDTEEIQALRKELNETYDAFVTAYGPLGRFTETVRERPDKEPIITRRYPAALRALRTDPHYATVVALERFNEDTGVARKATIFTERVVGAEPETPQIESPEDAIRVSLDKYGHVDQSYVAELLDVRETEVEPLVKDLVFLSPEDQETFITKEEYLSGNVRQKLYVAQALAEEDPRFLPHVDALTKIIPKELGPAEINVRLGAAWVPEKYVEEYLEQALSVEITEIERIDGEWAFKTRGGRDIANARWGIEPTFARNISGNEVMKKALNNDPLRVTYKDDDENVRVDQEATDALHAKVDEIHEHFQDWLWRDADRADELQKRYNDLYNGIVLRSYDDVKLTFPGKAASFNPHPHQHAAVARMLAEPSVGLFHEVGAGKTAEMVLGVMELRRLGLVKKPAIIVPNQMLEQFTREFKQIYPRAQVLAAGTDDISTSGGQDRRKLFVARAKTGDWDCVIMTHTAFEKIGLGEAQQHYAAERLAELEDVLEQKQNSAINPDSVKNLEKARVRAEEKLKKMMDLDQDEGISWDETGIDYLCVDEAHYFKNLTVVSKIGDLNKTDGSNRATDLDMKLWYHRDYLKQSRVATLATATPLPNSMIEMYVMMKYMRPDLLKEAEVYRADDWARQFTEQVTQVEQKVEGGGYHSKTRTTKFRNLPELLAMWHIPADVKTQADLNLNVPALNPNAKGERAPHMITVPPTAEQQRAMDEIIERAELVRNRMVDPTEDNMLKLTSDGRAVALDGRLRGFDGPTFEEETKLDVVANKVFEIWEENKDNEYLDEWGDVSDALGALQIVFSDLGTPKSDETFDVYNGLRDNLAAKGMDPGRIRFIHEATNDKAKAELFQQCRDGRVDVLIGSTDKMGIGTNVQARAIALHHIDAPWRPADVTQREGRIIRQGNQNSSVDVYRYTTEGSFDSYMWGTLARKAQFIEQVLAGRLDVREVDNSSEQALQFAEMQAITLGDKRIIEIANLKQEVEKLSRQERSHNRKLSSIRSRREITESAKRVIDRELETLEKVVLTDTTGENFRAGISVRYGSEPQTVTSREDLLYGLQRHINRWTEENAWVMRSIYTYDRPAPLPVRVHVGGLEWAVALRHNPKQSSDPHILFQVSGAEQSLEFEALLSGIQRADKSTAGSFVRRFEQRAQTLPATVARLKQKQTEYASNVEELLDLELEEWPRREDLKASKTRLEELEKAIEMEANNPHQSVAPQVINSAQKQVLSTNQTQQHITH